MIKVLPLQKIKDMEENNKQVSAFKNCVSLKVIDLALPKLKTLGHSCFRAAKALRIFGGKLPRLKRGKPRKTTYRTLKRFSAKRNR